MTDFDPIRKVAHDLKSPLSNIYTASQLLLDGSVGELTADQKDFIQRIFENSKRGINLVEDILKK